MKDHYKDKAHLESGKHAHGGGMPAFERQHWEHKMADVTYPDGRYSSEMNQAAEYKHNVDAASSYFKSHRAQH